ncbi:TPA: type I DNA topoisomerase [Patescibacteria group bacterium]|nr:MAG: topoisomerase protein [Parcubacteria group bacterium GW2011_GWB1_45_10]HCI05124.1 type I DNA topoisomerase [Patescibacteria group bacterium]
MTKKSEKTLIIVESPTKARTISGFLGSGFEIQSSFGHVRDLPKSKLGIEIENNFEPVYVVSPKAKENLAKLQKLSQNSKAVILATDEDREGEAIAFHLAQALNLKDNYQRIAFHEITKPAIEEALKTPRKINMDLVNAQQARRILDRLVGYELSPFLWKKIKYGLSAGRVQSAALRLLVEREKEIQAFNPEKYFTIKAEFSRLKSKPESFKAELFKINQETIKEPGIESEEKSQAILKDLFSSTSSVFEINKKELKKSPQAPYTTSTLQQDSFARLRYSAKQTMMLAQRLYEKGFITYMRTDSVNLSKDSVLQARSFVQQSFGKDYLPETPNFYKTKSKMAQEAHEAVRPTNAFLNPEEFKLKNDEAKEAKLYELVWRRFIACQMAKAVIVQEAAVVESKSGKNNYYFKANGQKIVFDGFLKVSNNSAKELILPRLEPGEALEIREPESEEHFTQPPARFNDASLVKTLELLGIGRPSTYASIISTLVLRDYVSRTESKSLQATSLGFLVTELLVSHFNDIVDYQFTAKIEDEFDEIAEKGTNWQKMIKNFYEPFHENLVKKETEVTRAQATERPSEEICDKCGSPMVVKYGRFGEFLGCSKYPECSNIKKLPKQNHDLGILCPECGAKEGGKVVLRRTKAKKRVFYGCSRWPACNFMSWKKPADDE